MNLNDMLIAWRFCTDNNMPDEAKKLRGMIANMMDFVSKQINANLSSFDPPKINTIKSE